MSILCWGHWICVCECWLKISCTLVHSHTAPTQDTKEKIEMECIWNHNKTSHIRKIILEPVTWGVQRLFLVRCFVVWMKCVSFLSFLFTCITTGPCDFNFESLITLRACGDASGVHWVASKSLESKNYVFRSKITFQGHPMNTYSIGTSFSPMLILC